MLNRDLVKELADIEKNIQHLQATAALGDDVDFLMRVVEGQSKQLDGLIGLALKFSVHRDVFIEMIRASGVEKIDGVPLEKWWNKAYKAKFAEALAELPPNSFLRKKGGRSAKRQRKDKD